MKTNYSSATPSIPNSQEQKKKEEKFLNHPILKKLSHTHIAVPLLIFYSSSVFFLYYGIANTSIGATKLLSLFFASILFFTFVEYWIHRKIFHMLPTSKIKEKLQYAFHGLHHDQPRDKTRLAMPPIMSVTLMFIIFGVSYLLIGNYAFGFVSGFLTGYASYLAVHYIVHAYPPPKNVFRTLWIHHGIHHYKDDKVAFGVSSPLWDWIFRTMPKKSYR